MVITSVNCQSSSKLTSPQMMDLEVLQFWSLIERYYWLITTPFAALNFIGTLPK
jgi:hypothetical protein